MARESLKTPLDFDASKAIRNAKKAKDAAKSFGRAGKRAGDETAKGMRGASAATDKFRGAIIGLGASALSLAALQRVVNGIIAAYEKAIRLRDEFARRGVGLMRGAAGPAAQFNVPEPAMAGLLLQIGKQAGVGRQDVGGLGDLMTALASAGMISDVTMGPGGAAQMSPADRAKMVGIAMWQQRTGTQAQSAAITRLVAGIQRGRPGTTVPGALGMMETVYRKSLLSDWGEYLTGAARGTLGLMGMGIAPETALSEYAAQAQLAATSTQAAETYRMVQERFVLADDPKMVREVDRRYGAGTYWRLKKTDQTALQQLIMTILTGAQGEAQAKVFARIGVAPEMAGRIGKLGVVAENAAEIRAAAMAAGPSTARDVAWRRGPRAITQAAEIEAETKTTALTMPVTRAAAARAIAEAQLEKEAEASPVQTWLWELISGRGAELGAGFAKHMADAYRQRYGRRIPVRVTEYVPSIAGQRVMFRPRGELMSGRDLTWEQYLEKFPEMRPILEAGIGDGAAMEPTTQPTTQPSAPIPLLVPVPVIINQPGVQFNQTPADVTKTPPANEGRIGE